MKTSDRDGMNTKKFSDADPIDVGMVVRMLTGDRAATQTDPFGDMVVIGVFSRSPMRAFAEIEIEVARPYLYASGLASSMLSAAPLVGIERLKVSEGRFREGFVKVLSARGAPMMMRLD